MGRIVDIAEKAGVSAKTVSRFLNGHPNVSAKTRRRIEEAIRELNYEPRRDGSGIGAGGSRAVGVFFGDPDAGYQVSLYRSLLRACQQADLSLVVEQFDESRSDWGAQVSAFLDRSRVDKIVLVPPLCDSFEIQSILNARKVRYVLICPSRPVSGAPSIAVDDRLAALEMTQHLIGLGHQRIGFLAGRQGHVATLLRRQGFEEAYTVSGLAGPDPDLIRPADFSFQVALVEARALLERPDRPTAIFACNDEMAAAVLFVANHLGLSVPRDLSVAGFDNTQISRTVWPELTTISQSYDLMAELAVEQVCASPPPGAGANLINSMRVAPHHLLVRASTGPASQKQEKMSRIVG
ncbi:LacI family DNA-binding transcriptional regulator [Marinicauda algicola]|uniref:LacI family DNA-binding transcriptional regulator n=1 Tax=Marinicauda algicola TaxID=2029849 RepID=A0A4S2GW42_9PROT|nr:LacI family DNA-binding transcriptional regulator [Marinicauda algicola]TGY87276.1 LacI family DNA-binding transcriptional regulator [Marinicauda algicola]